MTRYKRPTKEEFYEQFITLNKTNKQLSQYYGCSENVIHRWKNYYNLRKPIELVVKSYKAKSPFQEPGFFPWNKGKKGLLLSQNGRKNDDCTSLCGRKTKLSRAFLWAKRLGQFCLR